MPAGDRHHSRRDSGHRRSSDPASAWHGWAWRRRVTRLVLLESAVWAAGNAVTTGAFVTYFARDLGATALMIGVIAAVPEMSGVLRLIAPGLIVRLGGRKRTCLTVSVAARFFSLGIPLIGMTGLHGSAVDPVWVLTGCLFASQAGQWIAYVAYLSWISDLVPEQCWGRFFAMRNACTLLVVLCVPVLAGGLRDRWIAQHPDPLAAAWAYVVPFLAGVVLMSLSLVPLVLVPRAGQRRAAKKVSTAAALSGALAQHPFRRLLAYGCWLALWSGLMQAPFFLYLKNELAVGLAAVSLGYTLMRIGQIPASLAAGVFSDRIGNKPVLAVGLLGVAVSPVFLSAASSGKWWLMYGTFVCWSAWGAVNVCQQNLMLKVAPRGGNSAHIAMFQGATGLCAGISGIIGGWLLDALQRAPLLLPFSNADRYAYHLIFLLSAAGRATAIVWLLRVAERHGTIEGAANDPDSAVIADARGRHAGQRTPDSRVP